MSMIIVWVHVPCVLLLYLLLNGASWEVCFVSQVKVKGQRLKQNLHKCPRKGVSLHKVNVDIESSEYQEREILA